MIRPYLTFVFLCLIVAHIKAACPVGDLTLSTQTEIDDFSTTYSDCTEISGTLTIAGSTSTEILNLDGLSPLLSVSGDLVIIENQDLLSISGLSNLTSVGGNIQLEDLNDLASLTPLSGLSIINGDLIVKELSTITSLVGLDNVTTISGNLTLFGLNNVNNLSAINGLSSVSGMSIIFMPNLPNLNGLEAITSLTDLEIVSNTSLVNLSGLDNLTNLSGSLKIESNNVLSSLTGLEGLTSTGFFLQILSNPALTSLSGLDNLETINGQFWIGSNSILNSLSALNNLSAINSQFNFTNNSAITNFSGLESLLSVDGQLEITGNGMLQSLSGLENITTINGDLNVIGNTNLSDCAILSVCEKIDLNPADVNFAANDSNCSSNADVIAVCLSLLPVELSGFSAKTQSGKSLLNWSTASESNNHGFIVEHSTDGHNFKRVGFIPGFGSTDRTNQYAFVHDNPIKGFNYYRLKQMDISEDFSFSHTLSVFNDFEDLLIFPNPTSSDIQLSGYTPEQFEVRIASIGGELIEKIEGHQGKVISLEGYEPGVYVVQVFTAKKPRVFRVIKK